MKKCYLLCILPLMALTVNAQTTSNSAASNKKLDQVTVYTTADNSDLRLSKTGTHKFKKAPQPLETEISVFVDPKQTFQTVLGIGGAITDASAEVFATLYAKNQQKFLEAYFDKDAGIGYSLLRTTIHSSDFSSNLH